MSDTNDLSAEIEQAQARGYYVWPCAPADLSDDTLLYGVTLYTHVVCNAKGKAVAYGFSEREAWMNALDKIDQIDQAEDGGK